MKNVIAAAALLSLFAVASPAEAARRWFGRAQVTYSTCPNGQCYQAPAPVVETKTAATTESATTAPAATATETAPAAAPAVVAPAPAPQYPVYSARRARLRWFRR